LAAYSLPRQQLLHNQGGSLYIAKEAAYTLPKQQLIHCHRGS
jgi:hypothetical protein